MTDPIADFLTRVRNAVKANHKVVEAPGSKMKQAITKILFEQGYILAYKFEADSKGHPIIKIALKYHPETKTNAIKGLKRVSRPGLRRYATAATGVCMPRAVPDREAPGRKTSNQNIKIAAMSRIGKLPVDLPAGVTVTVGPGNVVSVKGPLGQLSQKVDSDITVTVEGNQLTVTRPTDQPRHRSMHGLYRALIHNMVVGVSKGYEIKQELVGVGFKAEAKGQILELSLGYSHDIFVQLPPEIKVEAVTEKKGNPIVTLKSIDKQLIGQVAAKIRSLRKPEPYKGKGIKFVGEQLRRKAGKSANAK